MIYDKIENAGLYKGLNTNLDTALDFIRTHDLNALPLGRTEIDGDNVFLNKMEATATPAQGRPFEVHRVYMDIQIDLQGCEGIETGDAAAFACPDFSAEKDVGFNHCPTVASCSLVPGSFTVCMAGEPHKPGIALSQDTALVKCVLKVRA